MSQQRTVNIQTSGGEEGVAKDKEKRETSAFFFQYISRRAEKDQDLRVSDAEIIVEQKEQAVQAVRNAAAINVASKLADMGDEIDANYRQDMNEIIELTGSPESAYTTFLYVVENMFTWDENGQAVINLGRLASLMAYCYHLCKTYIMRKVATGNLIVTFMGLVSGWLFKFLLRARFYEWLQSQGGWGQLILGATSSASRLGTTLLVLGGVAVLTVVAYSFFKVRR